MSSALGSLLAFIVAISVLVAVHEFGHYIVGRWMGMKVLRFSIGFGKPIWMRAAGTDQTEYCIASIPLGGYVRFLDDREGPVQPEDEGRAFNHRPIPARIAVLLAGPAFNFLFAIFAYWALFVNGVPTLIPTVGDVVPGTYAADAGLEYGDRIVAVGDVDTADWESTLLVMLEQMVDDGRIPLTLRDVDGYERRAVLSVGADSTRLTEPGLLFDGLGFSPWQIPAEIGEFSEDGPASTSGLAIGDRITSIGGEAVGDFGDLSRIVSARPGAQVEVIYQRGDRSGSIDLVIGEYERDGNRVGLLGIRPAADPAEYIYLRKFGWIESTGQAVARTWASTKFTVSMLARMVMGDVSIKNISGPINIAQFAGQSAERGLGTYLNFLAIVSISLGVLNLLPVPILDGGQIVYQTVEAVKGSPMSERSQLIGQQFGILALILLMSFAFYNDIARILG